MFLIDKTALMNHIESEYREWGDEYDALQILGDIDDFPVVEVPEQKTGQWVEDDEQTHVEKTYHCSECGWPAWGEDEKTCFCPNCEARMKGENDDKQRSY